MARLGTLCFVLSAAFAAGIKVDYEPEDPHDKGLRTAIEAVMQGAVAGAFDPTPLEPWIERGFNKMLAGLIPNSTHVVDQVREFVTTAVAALKSPAVLNNAFKAMRSAESHTTSFFEDMDKAMDRFAVALEGMKTADEAAHVEQTKVLAKEVFDSMDTWGQATMHMFRTEVVPLLPEQVQQNAAPLLQMGDGAVGGTKALLNMQIDDLGSTANLKSVCNRLGRHKHPPMFISMLFPMLENAKSRIPNTTQRVSRQSPAMMENVTNLMDNMIEVGIRVGHKLETTLELFSDKVVPTLTEKLKCSERVRKNQTAGKNKNVEPSAAATLRPGILLAAVVSLIGWVAC